MLPTPGSSLDLTRVEQQSNHNQLNNPPETTWYDWLTDFIVTILNCLCCCFRSESENVNTPMPLRRSPTPQNSRSPSPLHLENDESAPGRMSQTQAAKIFQRAWRAHKERQTMVNAVILIQRRWRETHPRLP